MKTWNMLRFWRDSEHSLVTERSQGPGCITGVSNLKKAEHKLKTWEEYTFCRERYGRKFWETQGILFIDFLIEQRTINATYYSKLLKDREEPAFRSKRRVRSVKRVCLLHDNARPHTCDNRTLEWMHWEVLPHPTYSPDPVPSDFHLFGPLKKP
jgi:hypothetical protein